MLDFASVSPMSAAEHNPVPPSDIEAEQALIGALLAMPAARDQVPFLQPVHFFNPVHARIFEVMGELHGEGVPADLVMVNSRMADDPLVPMGGITGFLARLMDSRGVLANVANYGKTIFEKAVRRDLTDLGPELAVAARNPTVALADIASRIESVLHRVKETGQGANDGLTVIHFDDMKPQLTGGYLVKGLLGSSGMAVIYGAPGSGKTFFALRLGLSVAAGTPFFGRRTRKSGVVYLAAEAGRSIANRVVAAKGEFPAGTPFMAVTSQVDLCSCDADVTRLAARINATNLGVPIGLIIIDTLSRVLAGGNENAPDDMGALVSNLDKLREMTGCFIAIVHHSGKDIARGARGHSLLYAATDAEIEVSADKETRVSTARVTKQRDFGTDGAFGFELRDVVLGQDEDGDAVTSCTVTECDAPPEAPAKAGRPLTGAAAAGMDQLTGCLATSGTEPIDNAHIPRGVTCVTLDLWKSWLISAGIINPDGNPREQFRRIRVTLQGRKIIGVWGNFVWASHASHAVT